jgi:hypothetical protein
MPRKGGGQQQGAGRGFGRGGGQGRGRGGLGGGGFCICPKCGKRTPHHAGMPCLDERCTSCGAALVREGSFHHQEIENRRADRESPR